MIKGIGIDIIEIKRIKNLIDRHGERFVRRIFSDEEIRHCQCRKDPSACFAARFAAREAFVKALGTGISKGMRFQDVVVESNEGAPLMRLSGFAHMKAEERGVKKIHLSLSHESLYAAAVVILED